MNAFQITKGWQGPKPVTSFTCSGQQIPETNLSQYSAVTGDSPSFA